MRGGITLSIVDCTASQQQDEMIAGLFLYVTNQ